MRAWVVTLAVLLAACRGRRGSDSHATGLPAAEIETGTPGPGLVRLTTRVFARGTFAGPQMLLLSESDHSLWTLDLRSGPTAPHRADLDLGLPEDVFVDDYADANGVVWMAYDDEKDAGRIFTSDLRSKPKEVGRWMRGFGKLAMNGQEVFVQHGTVALCGGCPVDSEVLAFSRDHRGSRLVMKGEAFSFDVDDTDVYWLERSSDPTVYRMKHTGGTRVEVGKPGGFGPLYVLRDHVVHKPSNFNEPLVQIAPKGASGFKSVDAVDLAGSYVVHDRDGLCWLRLIPYCIDGGKCFFAAGPNEQFEPRIRCWNPDLSRPRIIDVPYTPKWLAISTTTVVFGTSKGVFSVQRSE